MQTNPQTTMQQGGVNERFIRPCRQCKEMFTARHRGCWYCGDACRETGQVAIRAEVKRRYAERHPDRLRASREAWRRRNPEKRARAAGRSTPFMRSKTVPDGEAFIAEALLLRLARTCSGGGVLRLCGRRRGITGA